MSNGRRRAERVYTGDDVARPLSQQQCVLGAMIKPYIFIYYIRVQLIRINGFSAIFLRAFHDIYIYTTHANPSPLARPPLTHHTGRVGRFEPPADRPRKHHFSIHASSFRYESTPSRRFSCAPQTTTHIMYNVPSLCLVVAHVVMPPILWFADMVCNVIYVYALSIKRRQMTFLKISFLYLSCARRILYYCLDIETAEMSPSRETLYQFIIIYYTSTVITHNCTYRLVPTHTWLLIAMPI